MENSLPYTRFSSSKVAFLFLLVIAWGCASNQTPVNSSIINVAGHKRFPTPATLYIDRTEMGKSITIDGIFGQKVINLGSSLSNISRDVFTKIFKNIEVTHDPSELQGKELVIHIKGFPEHKMFPNKMSVKIICDIRDIKNKTIFSKTAIGSESLGILPDYKNALQNSVLKAYAKLIPEIIRDEGLNTYVAKSSARFPEKLPPTYSVDVDTDIPKTGMKNLNSIAVIIGNKNYQHRDVPPVDFAIRDASAVKDYVVNTLGYREGNVIFKKNATKAEFLKIFGEEKDPKGKLYKWVKPGKSDVFIYYAGHGAPDIESKQGYFVPVDSDPQYVKLTGYPLDTFYKNLSQLKAKSIIVVIDACFSGSSEKGMLLKGISPMLIEVSNPLIAMDNATIFTSASGEQVSTWYPEKKHSLFTYYFLKALKGEGDLNKDKKLLVNEIYDYINEHVPYMARKLTGREQNPQLMGNKELILIQY